MEEINVKNNNERYKIVFLFFVLSVLFCYPYLSNTIMRGHDLDYHLLRITGLAQGLLDGQFPVKIHPQILNGLGYANSLFYPDIFLYISAFLCIIGVSVITSYKILIFIATFATMLIMYYSTSKIFNNKYIAILSSILYTFSSYRITDVYMRTDLGEIIAIAFIPLIIYGCYEIYMGSYKRWYILAIGMTGVIYSHIITALFCVGIVAIFTIINLIHPYIKRNRIKYAFYAAFLTFLLSCAYILPYMEQISNDTFKFSNNNGANLTGVSMAPVKLFMNTYKYGLSPYSDNGTSKSMSLGIGLPLIVIVLLRMFIKINDKRYRHLIDTLIFISVIALFATTKLCPWDKLLFLGIIQFPWRLLIVAMPCLSIVSSYIVMTFLEKNQKQMLLILSLIFIAIANNQLDQAIYQAPQIYYNSYYPDANNIIGAEYLPKDSDLNKLINTNYRVNEIENANKYFKYEKYGTKVIIYDYKEDKTNINIEIPLLYYKGYTAYLYDGDKKVKLPVTKDKNSLVQINTLDNLNGKIIVKYSTTLLQYLGYFISAITLVVFVYKLVKYKKNLKYLNS